MRHVMVWAWMAGCAAQAADGEVVTDGMVQTLAEYDCDPTAGDPRVEIVVPVDVAMTVEVCGTIASSGDLACQRSENVIRYGEDVTIFCTTRAPITAEGATAKVWTLSAPE